MKLIGTLTSVYQGWPVLFEVEAAFEEINPHFWEL